LCPMQARMVLATHCWTLLTPACACCCSLMLTHMLLCYVMCQPAAWGCAGGRRQPACHWLLLLLAFLLTDSAACGIRFSCFRPAWCRQRAA
jgi:hypothetical protein